MRNKILAIILSIMAVLPLALAQGVPENYPIGVKLITNIPSGATGVEIQISDVSLGITKIYQTNELGELIINAMDISSNVRTTDTFKILVSVCSSDARCSKTFILQDYLSNPSHIFDLTQSYCFTCPTQESCEGQGYIQPPQCVNYGYILPENCPKTECPTDDVSTYLYAILVGVFAFLVSKYVPYKDKIRITHYLDRYRKRKIKIEKYERYTKTDGTYGYKWKTVSNVYA